MSVLDRKLRRDLFASKGLVLAIASIIAVGIACYVGLGSAYRAMSGSQHQYYVQCRMADFWIDVKKVPLAELDVLRDIPEITSIRPRIQFAVTVDLERVSEPLNGLVLSLPERHTPMVNDIVLRRGSYFTDTRDDEVIVNDAFAREHGLHPGDTFHVLLNNRRQQLHVVGTAISSEFVYVVGPGSMIPDPKRFGVFYLKRRYMEEVFGFQGACNQIVGLLSPAGQGRPAEVLARAERRLAPYGVFSTIALEDQASNRYLTDEIAQLAATAVAIPGIFLVVAAAVLNVLLTRLVEHQRTTIGTLKALGYSNARVLMHFFKFSVTVGLAGGLAGSGLGYQLANFLTKTYRQYFEFPELVNRFVPALFATALALSLVCALLGAAQGVLAVVRLAPAEAMRAKPPRRGGAIWLERIAWLWRRLSTAWRMSVRNVLRNRLRTTLGMFAAAMGTALLVYGLLANAAMFYLIDFQFYQVWRSDIDLVFQSERSYDALLEAQRLPGVTYAEPVLSVACTFVNGVHQKRGGITGLVPNARLTVPRDVQGRAVRVPSTGVVLSRTLAEILHVGRGDLLTIRPTKGLREPHEVRVASVVNSYVGLTAYADLSYLCGLLDEEFAMSGAQLEVDPNPVVRRKLYRELKQLPALQGFSSREDIVNNMMATFVGANLVFIGMLILFSGVIFFGSTLNFSLIALAEREREVATLLVLGYNPFTVGALFLRESLLVNLTGTLLGLPLGYLLMLAMVSNYSSELFRIPVVAPPNVWGWTLALSVVFCLVSHAAVQRSIHTTDWWEKLKVKE